MGEVVLIICILFMSAALGMFSFYQGKRSAFKELNDELDKREHRK